MGSVKSLAYLLVLATAYPVGLASASDLVFIQGGEFVTGDKFGDGDKDELPLHTVRVPSFWMSKCEVTQREYLAFCTEMKSCYPEWMEEGSKYNVQTGTDKYYVLAMVGEGKDQHPIVGISWYDAIEFCNWRSAKEGLQTCYVIRKREASAPAAPSCGCGPPDTTEVEWNREANGYRLPTEAEWEFAATSRGKHNKFPWGNGAPTENLADESFRAQFPGYPDIEDYQDHFSCSSPVGSFAPNELGLYDMGGNVFEWCWDSYYGAYDKPMNGHSEYRVIRGGAWTTQLHSARTSERFNICPTCRGCNGGFRVVRNGPIPLPTLAPPRASAGARPKP